MSCKEDDDGTQMLLSWIDSFANEKHQSDFIQQDSNAKLQAALESSSHLGVPNPFRTAICFEIMLRVTRTFSRYQHLTNLLLEESLRAIYCLDDDEASQILKSSSPGSIAKTLFKIPTYFTNLQKQSTTRLILQNELSAEQEKLTVVIKRLKNKQYMLKKLEGHWAHTFSMEVFRAWHGATVVLKNQRVKLNKALERWSRRRILHIFAGWKHLVLTKKRIGKTDQLVSLQKLFGKNEGIIVELESEIDKLSINSEFYTQDIVRKHKVLADARTKIEKYNTAILESEERQLQMYIAGWEELNTVVANTQLSYLQSVLNATERNNQDVSVLGENKDLLDKILVDELVLCWCNYHLEGKSIILNFGSDVVSCEGIWGILVSLSQDYAEEVDLSLDLITEMNYEEREALILEKLDTIFCIPHNLISPGDIIGAKADKVFTFLSYLFCQYPGMTSHLSELKEAQNVLRLARDNFKDLQNATASDGKNTSGVPKVVENFIITKLEVEKAREAHECLSKATRLVMEVAGKRAGFAKTFKVLRTKVQTAAWQVILHRNNSTVAFKIPDRKEAREKALFTTVDAKRLQRLWDNDDNDDTFQSEITKIETVLRTNYADLRRIFQHYAASDAGDACTMSMDEFYAFLKDCKLISKSSLSISQVQRIFKTVNESDVEDDPLNPDFEFTQSEFVEALVHVAEKKSQKKTHQVPPVTSVRKRQVVENPAFFGISNRVRELLQDNILPHACRSNSDFFRQQVAASECKKVFEQYRVSLQSLYRRFADPEIKALTAEGFHNLLVHCDLVSEFFTLEDMHLVFTKIQQDDAPIVIDNKSSINFTGMMELTYSEFCEGMAAVAAYHNSDPFLPLCIKLKELLKSVCGKKIM